jgi:putative exporter of polyketide antibiotics
MSQTANNIPQGVGVDPVPGRFDARILRIMMAITVIGAAVSLVVGSWRISVGLVVGGALAILNHRWLQSSTAAAFSVLIDGQTPRITLTKYMLRYLVIASVVLIVYELGLAPLPAIVAGLSSFVLAVFVEALRELYFAIMQREEIS